MTIVQLSQPDQESPDALGALESQLGEVEALYHALKIVHEADATGLAPDSEGAVLVLIERLGGDLGTLRDCFNVLFHERHKPN